MGIIDRKIFNVDKNLTSAGGTALDIMRTIPSVTVDAEGTLNFEISVPRFTVMGDQQFLHCNNLPQMTWKKLNILQTLQQNIKLLGNRQRENVDDDR